MQVLDFMTFITTTSMATMPAHSDGGTGSLALTNNGESFVPLRNEKRKLDS